MTIKFSKYTVAYQQSKQIIFGNFIPAIGYPFSFKLLTAHV